MRRTLRPSKPFRDDVVRNRRSQGHRRGGPQPCVPVGERQHVQLSLGEIRRHVVTAGLQHDPIDTTLGQPGRCCCPAGAAYR